MKSNWTTISILGAGTLGQAIAERIHTAGLFKPKQITLTRRDVQMLKGFKKRGYNTTSDNIAAINSSDILLLAVEPKHLSGILEEINDQIDPKRHLLISVVAGVDTASIRSIIGKEVPLVRAAPNTAAIYGESMTCISSDRADQSGELERVHEIFDALGETRMIDESLMPAATALCASGIAFFLRAMRSATLAGVEAGFSPEEAHQLTVQTAKGAAILLQESGRPPEAEIDRVTTPGGCTIAGLNRMEEAGFSASFIEGIRLAVEKAQKLD